MPIVVTTKDCTALSDAELVEMADLCADRPPGFDIGFLSKEREAWVLITLAVRGTSFGVTPFARWSGSAGLLRSWWDWPSVDRTARAEATLKGIMADQYRRALLAFPDEDVLLGTRLLAPEGFRAFSGLRSRAVPRAQILRRGAGLGAASVQALRLREQARRSHLRAQGRRLGGRWLDFLAPKVKIPEGCRRAFRGYRRGEG